MFDQNQAALIKILNNYKDISDIRVISNEYVKLFSEIPTEHILKNVKVGFEGSQAPVSYSVDIDKETNAPAERVAVINTILARNRLEDIFNGSTDPETGFSLNVYSNIYNNKFEMISNLFTVSTITTRIKIAVLWPSTSIRRMKREFLKQEIR